VRIIKKDVRNIFHIWFKLNKFLLFLKKAQMKKTPLYDQHVALEAKIVPFAGYEMPVQYQGILKEHMAVRNDVGVFDVSHMGEFFVRGPKALPFLQTVFSNDLSTLKLGQAQYGYMPNNNGGIVDDLIIYKLKEDEYMLVVNGANISKDWNWLTTNNIPFGAILENASDTLGLLALQGPNAARVLEQLTETKVKEIPFYQFEFGAVCQIPDVLISATGYTGSGGFELYVKNKDLTKLWMNLVRMGVTPCGLASRDTLRLEMGYCLYGNDIDETTSPMAAGLGWCTKFSKSFINDDILKHEKENGTKRRRVGFMLNDRGIPRKGYSILDQNGNEIGHVSSGTQSPSLGKGIGLGYVNREHVKNGTEIYIEIRNKTIPATITSLPFYKS
jgi:aminomethyltransferase